VPQNLPTSPRVAIACGGTGGHLFPGLAVAEKLRQHGCNVLLLVSPKEIDQVALKGSTGWRTVTLPAVGLTRGNHVAFLRGLVQSYRAARVLFKKERPDAVLAMGGFTSAPPILAGRRLGAAVFIHESNSISGRANRWLSWFVNEAFIGFSDAAKRLHTRKTKTTGTPVRPQFKPAEPSAARLALGLDAQHPVLLVTGGSQGASGLNSLLMDALPRIAAAVPNLQLFHLSGPNDAVKVAEACAAAKIKAIVHPFFADMHVALAAATAAVSRAGASSLAELAAMRLPSVLVPYPAATDNHQYYNALAFEKTGAAVLLDQTTIPTETFAGRVIELLQDESRRDKMRAALQSWHSPQAAQQIAESILQTVTSRRPAPQAAGSAPSSGIQHHQSALT
jgi:UDP-N-acetylglucosamine--N-acetylmuramyl-(pentapeptide) pyrophosphoryl-undecaprenol N-acetylglucosamine transferase